MMKRLLAALMMAAVASPAAALMAPQYYQQARDEASDVLVIVMLSVVPPPGLTGPCQVKGRVFNIERGAKRYEVGQTVTFGVMCRKGNAKIPAGGVMWTDRKALETAKAARAFLTPEGEIALYQFDLLPELPPEMDE
jgi:hypothetical protein